MGAVLLLILKSRIVPRLEARLAKATSRTWLVSLICALSFSLLVDAARWVIAALSIWLWPAGAAGVLVGRLSELPVAACVDGVGLWLLLLASRAAPRLGWIWLSGLTTAVIFCAVLLPPVILAPAARQDRPVAGPEAAAFLTFAQKGGLRARTLHSFESPDPSAVDMEGLGPFTHAAVSRAALAAPRPETFAAIGHLLGHYRYKDLWSLALLWSAFTSLFLLMVWTCRRPLSRWLGAASTDGALSLAGAPIIALIAWGTVVAATPAFNLFDQAINYRADDYAMSLTRDPDTLCRWLMATEAKGKTDPSPLEALLFYDHPPLKARLENAMRWKAAHGGL